MVYWSKIQWSKPLLADLKDPCLIQAVSNNVIASQVQSSGEKLELAFLKLLNVSESDRNEIYHNFAAWGDDSP